MPSDGPFARLARPASIHRSAAAHGAAWFGVTLVGSWYLADLRLSSSLLVAAVGAVVYAAIVLAWDPY